MSATADKASILVVEDEPSIRRLLKTCLTAEGYQILEAGNGAEALAALGRNNTEALLLDLDLRDIDGVEVIRRVRAGGSKVPIIVLLGQSALRAKIEAFEAGADDYLAKPFGTGDLMLRICAALSAEKQVNEPVFESGALKVDLAQRIVRVKGQQVKLSPKEYEVLHLLAIHAGKVLTRSFLVREVWGPGSHVHYLRIHIGQLRRKIEAQPGCPTHIITETGVGYRLRVHGVSEVPVARQETGVA
jgi:two-component system, OmpR family, KDP operon response regulator KdpE